MTGASKQSPPIAHAIYEEDTLGREGKNLRFATKAVRGESLQVVQHSGMLNGSKKEKAYHLKAFRPDLFYSIQAAAILYQQIEQACLELDAARGNGETER
jgi:hypothetical protein